jgi:hypothetical protein
MGMLLRYLWESHYCDRDNFGLYIDAYLILRKKFKNTLTKLEIMCLAHNLVKVTRDDSMQFCTNHSLAYSRRMCLIRKDIKALIGSCAVNSYFGSSESCDDFLTEHKHPIIQMEKWSKKQLDKLLRECPRNEI